MAGGNEGVKKDRTINTPMTWRHLHNMSLDLNLEDLQGPIHKAFDLSTDFLIQPLVSTFHFS
jgi:hypothetical protein